MPIHYLMGHFPDFAWKKNTDQGRLELQGELSPLALQQAQKDTLEQAMNTLRNRVNELGVSEAVVQQQGATVLLLIYQEFKIQHKQKYFR